MDESIDVAAGRAPQVVIDDQGRLIEDVGCRRCGYNLRSLEAGGVCPECGAAVALSIHGYYLRFAPPAWVARLSRGAWLLMAAFVAAIFGWLALIAFAIWVGVTATAPSSVDMVDIAATVVWLIIAGLAITGSIFLTSRDPAEAGKRERFGARRLVRYCLWAMPMAFLGGLGITLMGGPAGFAPLRAGMLALLFVVGITWVASFLILPAAMLRHTMSLMKRIPRPGLATFARIEFWAYLIVGGLGVLLYTGALIAMTVARPAFAALATSMSGPTTTMTALGYTSGPSGGGNSPSGNGIAPMTVQIGNGGQVNVVPAGITSMPTTVAFTPTPAMTVFGIIAGGAGVLSFCGGTAVGITGLVLLIMVWRALTEAARHAAGHMQAR